MFITAVCVFICADFGGLTQKFTIKSLSEPTLLFMTIRASFETSLLTIPEGGRKRNLGTRSSGHLIYHRLLIDMQVY